MELITQASLLFQSTHIEIMPLALSSVVASVGLFIFGLVVGA